MLSDRAFERFPRHTNNGSGHLFDSSQHSKLRKGQELMHDLYLPYGNAALLCLRLLLALVFGSSGWSHVSKAEERSKSIGLSKGITLFLGIAELLGALGIASGV